MIIVILRKYFSGRQLRTPSKWRRAALNYIELSDGSVMKKKSQISVIGS